MEFVFDKAQLEDVLILAFPSYPATNAPHVTITWSQYNRPTWGCSTKGLSPIPLLQPEDFKSLIHTWQNLYAPTKHHI